MPLTSQLKIMFANNLTPLVSLWNQVDYEDHAILF